MKFSTSKIAMAALLATTAISQQAVAHDQAGTLLNTSGTKATDYYEATCAPDPNLSGGASAHHLAFQLKDTSAGASNVGMTVINDKGATNAKAATTIDNVGGDLVYSPRESIAGGDGKYLITVFHTGIATTEGYTFILHCETINGGHTGTSIVKLSNQ